MWVETIKGESMIKINVTRNGFTWNDGKVIRNREVTPYVGEEDSLARGIISALKFANHGGELEVDEKFSGLVEKLYKAENLEKAEYVAAANLKYGKITVRCGSKVTKFENVSQSKSGNKTGRVEFTETGYKVKIGNEVILAKPFARKSSESEFSWKTRMLLSAVATNTPVGNYKVDKEYLEAFKTSLKESKEKSFKSKEEFMAESVANKLTLKKATISA